MKIGEFLNKLATKGGIDATDKHLIDILSKSEIANADINDELANKIDISLMTVEAAKSNPDVIKKIKGETLNGADALIDRLLAESGYDEADIADIKADKNTFNKIEKTAKKIKELEAKKAGANKPDKEAYQKQIDDLNGKMRDTATAHEKAINDIKSTHATELTHLELKSILATKKMTLPEDMAPALKNEIALNAVKAELQAKGFQIVNTNGTLEVKRTDGTDAYDASNRKVGLTELIDGALAQNKLLAVTDPNQPMAPVQQVIPGQNTQVVNQNAVAMIDKQLADAGAK